MNSLSLVVCASPAYSKQSESFTFVSWLDRNDPVILIDSKGWVDFYLVLSRIGYVFVLNTHLDCFNVPAD